MFPAVEGSNTSNIATVGGLISEELLPSLLERRIAGRQQRVEAHVHDLRVSMEERLSALHQARANVSDTTSFECDLAACREPPSPAGPIQATISPCGHKIFYLYCVSTWL